MIMSLYEKRGDKEMGDRGKKKLRTPDIKKTKTASG
jgi:hypothetical protein